MFFGICAYVSAWVCVYTLYMCVLNNLHIHICIFHVCVWKYYTNLYMHKRYSLKLPKSNFTVNSKISHNGNHYLLITLYMTCFMLDTLWILSLILITTLYETSVISIANMAIKEKKAKMQFLKLQYPVCVWHKVF